MKSNSTDPLLDAQVSERGDQQAKRFLLEFDDQAAFHLVNFYEPETVDGEDFRWSEPVAMVRLDVPPSDYEITIETGLLRGLTFPLKIFWNDQHISKKAIRITEGQIVFSVSREMFIRNDEQRLTLICKPLNAEQGRRQLGIPVKWVQMTQTGASEPEFANPTKTRSRFWRRKHSKSRIKKILGMKTPSPELPIWEMKLPDSPTSLKNVAEVDCGDVHGCETVIVSSVEINSRHGTGLLIQYMFEDFSRITTVSSRRRFHNDRIRSARHFEVPCDELQRHELYELVLDWFKASPPKRAYVVPYYKTELIVAIALADLFGTEICLHIMDDQCLYEEEIPMDLLDESMNKSALILLISPEMREAYQQRFEHRMYILPPVVPENMILNGPLVASETSKSSSRGWRQLFETFTGRDQKQEAEPRGIIIGNIWDEKWLAKLQQTIRGSGFEVDWYSNNPDKVKLSTHGCNLVDCGIHVKKPLWGQELVAELRSRPYAIMPSGMLGPDEVQESLARLSLPSRIPFVMSVSNMPIVVLGSPETAAGKFVQRFDLGAVIDYDQKQFSRAVGRIMEDAIQQDIRQRAAKLAPTFSATNMSKWILDSTGLHQPVDNRFESVFAGQVSNKNLPGISRRSNWNKEELRTMLSRLKDHDLIPETVVDVGSGDGAWSSVAAGVFPDAKFVLIEPLRSHYSQEDRKQFAKTIGNADELQLPVGDSQGRNEFSLNDVFVSDSDSNQINRLSLGECLTLDSVAKEKELSGPALLKIDSRCAESLVLAGGAEFIKSCVDSLILTVDLLPKRAKAKSYGEFLIQMNSLGFQLIDESEAMRCPTTNILLSKNLVFVKREITQKQLAA